jgi:hypothetical protein
VTSPTAIELMNSFYARQTQPSSPAASLDLLRRRPQRITFTAHWRLHQQLQRQADEEGRSLSGLIAYLLERSTTA